MFSLPQDSLPDIRDAAAKGTLSVEAFTRDGARSLARGDLTVIDSQIDPTNGQVRMKASFANEDRSLWPGAFVTARLLVRTDSNVTTVPARAVLRGQNGPYVYVVKADRTVEARPVKPGKTVDGVTAIAAGVALGETVVFDGQSRLANGTKVDAKTQPIAGVAPGAAS
jgi:multidrug efflux system membrane fusion protein